MTQPMSQRAYQAAVHMHQEFPQMAKPKPEDFAHLDVVPTPPAPSPGAVTIPDPASQQSVPDEVQDAAVRAALGRMQAATGVTFAAPGQPMDAA